jgi:O-antigen ligase
VRKVTFCILWVFVFSLPSEVVVSFESVGTISRLIGLGAALAGVLTILHEGRFRKPGVVIWLSLAFVMSNAISFLWTTDYDATLDRVPTYAQLFGLVWLIWEFAQDRIDQERLMLAYCLGAFVGIAQIAYNFGAGVNYYDMTRVPALGAFTRSAQSRFSVSGFDPNDCGVTLALGIPMAWHLFLNSRGASRLIVGYVPAACIAILLTASRAAFLSAAVALLIVPLAAPRGRRAGHVAAAAAVCLLAAAAALTVVPASNWNRIATAGQEITDGTLNGRKAIWIGAWRAFQERPLLGVGAGAFRTAVARIPLPAGHRYPHNTNPHNAFLAVLIEQGLVGFALFSLLIATCVTLMWRSERPDRLTATVLMLTWFVGSMALGWQYRKPTWLLFGLLATQASAGRTPAERTQRDRASEMEVS